MVVEGGDSGSGDATSFVCVGFSGDPEAMMSGDIMVW